MPTPLADGAAVAGTVRGGTARAVLELVRWPNALMAASGVLIGAAWAGSVDQGTWLATLAALALTAVANATNDAYDIEIDRLAHPARPLPRGAVSIGGARALAGAAAVVAVLAGGAVAPALGALSAAVAAAMLWYSAQLKRRGLPGNVLVALVASLPFLYGAWSVARAERGVVLVALAMPLHFAREVAKDIDDAGADAATRRTLPVVAGPRAARLTVLGASALFMTVVTAFFARRSLPALGLASAAVAVVGAAGWRVAASRRGAPRLLKVAMLLSMVALGVECLLRAA